MRGMRERLERDLTLAVNRLRQMGGVALDELPGPTGDNTPFADEVDEIVASEEREIMFGTRELLVDRVNRITAALDRHRQYGVRRVREAIAPARLRACRKCGPACCQDRIGVAGMGVLDCRSEVDED
jgi:hypothetical protein